MAMIYSMTGFGNASIEYKKKTISVEVKSVNSKFFDLMLKLPSSYREKEMDLRSELSRNIERGKTEVTFTIDSLEAYKKTSINKPLAKAYFDELKKLDGELKIKSDNYLQLILAFPDVMVSERLDLDEDEWKAASKALDMALKNFENFRKNEGKSLEKDILSRISSILKGIEELEKFESGRIEIVRRRLQSGLEEFIEVNNIDRNRLEQELIFYIEKFDISEEKVRLNTHCQYFIETINKESSIGKKLSFITQEMGREINTIGSKANDATMQKIVVVMKDDLEKIKEQVLNIL
jgi:uncharacterized protein (TIGR00255 family)